MQEVRQIIEFVSNSPDIIGQVPIFISSVTIQVINVLDESAYVAIQNLAMLRGHCVQNRVH
jgi:hypothetical protein